MSKQYHVQLNHHDGKSSLFTYRDRTQWTKRTALKHMRDVMNALDFKLQCKSVSIIEV